MDHRARFSVHLCNQTTLQKAGLLMCILLKPSTIMQQPLQLSNSS